MGVRSIRYIYHCDFGSSWGHHTDKYVLINLTHNRGFTSLQSYHVRLSERQSRSLHLSVSAIAVKSLTDNEGLDVTSWHQDIDKERNKSPAFLE